MWCFYIYNIWIQWVQQHASHDLTTKRADNWHHLIYHHLTIENVTLISYDSSTNKLIILSHLHFRRNKCISGSILAAKIDPMNTNKDHSIAHLTATLNGVLNDSVFWMIRLSQRFNDPCTNICLFLDESAVWRNRLNERLNDSLNKTAYHLHLRSLSTNQSNLFKTLFFKSVQTHFNFLFRSYVYTKL